MFAGHGGFFEGDTNPDALGGFFSGSSVPGRGLHQNAQGVLVSGDDPSTFTGFGPGDYSGDYTGQGDRVYWGPDGGPITYPPAAQLSVNTQPGFGDKFNTHMGGGILVKGAVKGAQNVLNGGDGGGSVAGNNPGSARSSTGDTILQARSETSSVVVPGAKDLPGTTEASGTDASGRSWLGSVTEGGTEGGHGIREHMSVASADVEPFTVEEFNSLSAGEKYLASLVQENPDFDTDQLMRVFEGWDEDADVDAKIAKMGRDRASYKRNVELWDRTRASMEANVALPRVNALGESRPWWDAEVPVDDDLDVPEWSPETDERWQAEEKRSEISQQHDGGDIEMQNLNPDLPESIYDGDSYHGDYTDDPGTATTTAEAGGGIEMQELRGPPSLHPHLDADGRSSVATALSDESPLLLGDMPPAPPNSVFDFNSIDWRNVDPRVQEAIGEYFESDAGTEGAYLGSEGIGQNLSLFSRAGFANFIESRLVDLGTGTMLMPLFDWIDKASDTPWVSRGIQGAMAIAGLVSADDPFGVIALPLTWGIQELQKQAERKLDNDNPDSNYGKRFGFVREGHKWYPAFLTRSERDEGWIGSDRTQIRMSYGTDLKFKRQKGTGKMIPYFDEGTYRQKDYHVWDNELDTSNQQSGKRWRDQSDPLRDFYFLDDDETAEFLKKLGGGDTVAQYTDDRTHTFTKEEQAQIQASQKEAFDMMRVHDDVSWADTWAEYGDEGQKVHYGQYDQYLRTLQDVRSGLELWQDYLTSEPGNIYTTHADEDQYSGARAFRRVLNDSGYLGYPGEQKGQMHRPSGSTAAEMQENALDATGRTSEGDWLVKERQKAMGVLYESQKRAGLSMHYDKLYGAPKEVSGDMPGWLQPFPASGALGKVKPYESEDGQGSIDRYAWRLYTDGTWEIGDTSTDEGLKDALRQIEASGDSSLIGTSDYRSADQRDYLANKAYVRYLDNKLDQMGLSGVSPYAPGDPYAQSNQIDIMQGFKEFGLPPQYSYADDFAKWGYNLPATRDKWTHDQMAKYPERQWADSWRDYRTQDPDFKLSDEDLRKAQEMPEWLKQVNQYVIKNGLSPDQVAGRYGSAEDYAKALDIISKRDPVYYAPADELQPDIADTEWDPYGDGVPLNDMPYDVVQHAYVRPIDKTPGLVYDPQTSTYHYPGTVLDAMGNWVSPKGDVSPDADVHKNNPAVGPVKPKVDPPESTAHGGDPIPDVGIGMEDTGYRWLPQVGVDIPEGFYWDANAQVAIGPSGRHYTMEEQGPMWEEYFEYSPNFGDDGDVEEGDFGDEGEEGDVEENPPVVPTVDHVDTKPSTVPDDHPGAGAHVHEEAHDEVEQPPLPAYMQQQHKDRVFQHSSAPMHLPPAHIKVI